MARFKLNLRSLDIKPDGRRGVQLVRPPDCSLFAWLYACAVLVPSLWGWSRAMAGMSGEERAEEFREVARQAIRQGHRGRFDTTGSPQVWIERHD